MISFSTIRIRYCTSFPRIFSEEHTKSASRKADPVLLNILVNIFCEVNFKRLFFFAYPYYVVVLYDNKNKMYSTPLVLSPNSNFSRTVPTFIFAIPVTFCFYCLALGLFKTCNIFSKNKFIRLSVFCKREPWHERRFWLLTEIWLV